ncbi:MAG: CHAT domain-containing protein [uncultured Aureispira sp.]|uniref:CHAT domain-containing protein n=1 Tax=uncultured Aureispira sp. TaxID=1331704 RepID=A0A6S6TT63_9BACT|nr:MAG: CHAT domain-containing protein [uncultured Aureispira sp.]
MENKTRNEGNNNIIIQGITDSTITLEVNGVTQEIQNEMASLNALLERINTQQVEIAGKIYALGELGQADLGLKKTFNVFIIKKLMFALAEHGLVHAQTFLDRTKSIEGWENNSRVLTRAKQIISNAFVSVIGIQLRKIIAIGQQSFSEEKQETYIKTCYQAAENTIQLLNFTLISVFWDVQKISNYELNEAETEILSLFFDDSIGRNLLNDVTLLEVLLNIFEKNEIPLPLKELKELNVERFKQNCSRIQKLESLLEKSQHSLITCFEMEGQLTEFLTHLILFMNYDMLSVKSGVYDKKRTSLPKYIQSYIELGIEQKFNESTEVLNILKIPVVTNSVLICNKQSKDGVCINLSPFVIDYNTQVLEKGAKICFFFSKGLDGKSIDYRFLEDNTIENVPYSNMLKENIKMEDLMRDNRNHIKLKFDIIIEQFEAAKNEVLKNSSIRKMEE